MTTQGGKVSLERRADLLQRAEPRICAFDIGARGATQRLPRVAAGGASTRGRRLP